MTDKHPERSARGTRPRVLLLATGKWISTARLAMALASMGCEIHLMALKRHPAALCHLQATYPYNPLRPLQSIRSAMRHSHPDVVIPADELAVLHLEELWRAAKGESGEQVRSLLRRSMGSVEVISAARSRMTMLTLAREEGIATPETIGMPNERDMETAIRQLGLPLVLKADATSGGRGVRVIESAAEGRKAWRALHNTPSLPRVIRRAAAWREWTYIRLWARRETRDVSAQAFVQGRERTAMAVAHEGTVLAFVCMEVVETWALRGPASVLRVIDDAAMEFALRALVRRLGVSGFCGFDFMVKEGTDTPLLIEMNPRPTQLAHLALGAGRDLVAAYIREVVGDSGAADRPAITEGDLIALFPQELQRDPQSEWLRTGYHDVPWQSPELMQRALNPLPAMLTEDARWKAQRE